MEKKYIVAQNRIIEETGVEVHDYCKFGCRARMHAHPKERCVCKWTAKNSAAATFDLFHEIGHCETTTSKMRRAEQEYYATQWAIDKMEEYGFEVPIDIVNRYQQYIDREKDRGLRRGGTRYGDLTLERSCYEKTVSVMIDPSARMRVKHFVRL